MRLAADIEDFRKRPVGAVVLVETTLIWCHSRSLAGVLCWGSPNAEQTQRVLAALETLFLPALAPQLDIVLDGSRIESTNPGAVLALFEWTRDHLAALSTRIRLQAGVLPAKTIDSLAIAGVLPLLGGSHRWETFATPVDALRKLLGSDGDALNDELNANVERFAGTAPVIGELRALLRAHQGNLTVQGAASLLTRSVRSLQRELEAERTSFRDEQVRARLAAAEELLRSRDDKISSIAARLGVGVHGLTRLVRARRQVTPQAWRRQLRAG
jgi:AraC-like DNA-binding protein